jgi:MoxR-like ATPase
VGYVSKEMLLWALQQLKDWQDHAGAVRQRRILPRFIVLKRLGVPTDGTQSPPISTTDFSRATLELFGVATAEEAADRSFGAVPRYLNPFTGDYLKGAGSSDWAIGTLWTRNYDPIEFTTGVQGGGSGGQQSRSRANQPRRMWFRNNYLDLIAEPLGTKIPLLPLCIFLARKAAPWIGTGGNGFGDLAELCQKVIEGLHLTQDERDRLFAEQAAPDLPLAGQELSGEAIFDTTLEVFPFQTGATDQAPPPVGGAQAALGTPNWDIAPQSEDPCELKGLAAPFERARVALASGKHVVFYGPPGTGKSQLAECICKTLGVDYALTTATSDWTTFDTIGGYFPKSDEPSKLDFLPGVVLESIERSRWLIIDELNRADIDKAFGQLFSILSRQTVTLPFRNSASGERLTIGPSPATYGVDLNWRLLATMNTFDKSSLFQLSYALMRRFAFVEVPAPEGHVLQEIMEPAMEDWPQDGREAAGNKLVDLFCSPDGLRVAGREVGAAIPLDICRAIAVAPEGEVSDAYLVDLLDMYLFPQFEGLDRDHPKILQALKDTLELDDGTFATLQRRLTGWTGYRQ